MKPNWTPIRSHVSLFFPVVAIFVLACGTMALAVDAQSANWSVGTAQTVITPDQFMWMSGYASRTRPAAGKLHDLWAKALVIEDREQQQALLISLDLIGIDRGISTAICQRIEEQLALPRRCIALCCSHTHSGPAVARNLRTMYRVSLDDEQKQLVARYTDQLIDKVALVAQEAMNRLQPASLSWETGQATFAVNRRENSESEVPLQRELGRLRGPVDYDVPVLAARDVDGKLLAIAFGYACHATVLSGYQWCGDYPGYAHQELERRHAEAIALFWAGCGGDQNPLPRRDVALAAHYGRTLADAVDAVLAGRMQPIEGRLQCTYGEVPLPLGELPTRDELIAETADDNRFVAGRAEMLLEQLDREGSLIAQYPYPVQTWRIGDDVRFVLLGGEVVVDYALRLKRELEGQRAWIAAYANDVMAYIPSRRVLAEGGYEGGGAMVYYGLPTVWAPTVEETIVAEVHRQLASD